jgi:hypothetical protein
VGKTRLIGELTAQADRAGFTVLLGHCIELGAEGLPLAVLAYALLLLRQAPARRGTAAIPAEPPAEVLVAH